MSKASPEYPTPSTGESINRNRYRNKVIHINSLKYPTVIKLDVYSLYQKIGVEQDIPSHKLKRITAECVELYRVITLPG